MDHVWRGGDGGKTEKESEQDQDQKEKFSQETLA